MNNPEDVQPPEEQMEEDEVEIFSNPPDWLDELVANHNMEEVTEGNIVIQSLHVRTISNIKRGWKYKIGVVCNKITQISKIDGFEYFDSPIKYFLSFYSPIIYPWDEETVPNFFSKNFGLVMRSAVTYGTKIVTYGTVIANISNSINKYMPQGLFLIHNFWF